MPATSPTLSPTLSAITAGVSRVVFGDVHFDFSDEVGSDVSGLCENTTSNSRKQRNRRSTKPKPSQRLQRLNPNLILLHIPPKRHQIIKQTHTRQPKSNHRKPHNTPTRKRNPQRRRQPFLIRRLRSPHIRIGSYNHTGPPGTRRQNRTGEEATGDSDSVEVVVSVDCVEDEEGSGEECDEDGEVFVFGGEECFGA